MIRVLQGDCRDVLKTLPDESVHCVVTSPPYWGLRDYGTDGQLGLEPTFQEYIETMTGVFREVKRVLRRDGTAWVNMGDSYASTTGSQSDMGHFRHGKAYHDVELRPKKEWANGLRNSGLKPKDLCGIPWRLAFALQADGWYLRSDIIWSKPNPMPESVTDRPTKAHEYLFLLSKSNTYYYDAEAIVEPVSETGGAQRRRNMIFDPTKQTKQTALKDSGMTCGNDGERNSNATSRNRRTVWEIATAPFSEAHFATFPPALVEPCVLAGCPKDGTVLDPFGGAGTTGLVADRLGRNAILIELNPKYAEMAQRRLSNDAGMFASVAAE